MLTPEDSAETCNFCNQMRSIQLKYMKDIRKEFQNLTIWESNKLKEEPLGLEGLRKLAKEVYKDLNADKILSP